MKKLTLRLGYALAVAVLVFSGTIGPRANNSLAATPTAPTTDATVTSGPSVPQFQPGNPKLEYALSQVSKAFQSGSAQLVTTLTTNHRMMVNDGSICVIVEADPNQLEQVSAAIASVGAHEEMRYKNLLQVWAPIEALPALASLPQVNWVRLPYPMRRPSDVPDLSLFTTVDASHPAAGAVLSEGVHVIGADAWQQAGIQGQGVTVAIIDAGFQDYSTLLGTELPASVNTRSFRADGDITGGGEVHGTAVAEIIHDVAPAAQLYLINFNTDVEWLNAVDFAVAQGIPVISSSVGFYVGPFDGTSTISQKVTEARNAGVFWAQSSGNEAIGHWHGTYSDANNDSLNDFTPGTDLNVFTLQPGQQVQIVLSWDDWPASNQDYNLFLYAQQSGQWVLVDQSTNIQSGTQPPFEAIVGQSVTGGTFAIAIQRFNATRDVHLQLYAQDLFLQFQRPDESLIIPADSTGAVTTGATNYANDILEHFSSQGPTTDGRIKPDLTAPDGVSTATYGPQNFLGTSASAPHLAGAAALVLSANPGLRAAQIQSLLEQRAVDLGPPGKDNLYGSGRLNLGPPPGGSPGPAPANGADAKIEIVFPHDAAGNPASVTGAPLANLGAFLFSPGTLNPVSCSFSQTVRLYRALNTSVAEQVATATSRQIASGGKQIVVWEFNNVDVSAATDPLNKYYFFMTIDGVPTNSNIWSHGADARTIFPQQDVAVGIAPLGSAVDARIEIAFPHDSQGNSQPVTAANLLNLGVDLFSPNSLNSVPPEADLTVRLFRSLNNDVEVMVDTGTKTMVTNGGVTYPRWVFNNVDVSAAQNPLNKYYFRVEVDGLGTRSTIWSHGSDARTNFPVQDVPASSCG